jgi:hypothetical protein
MQPCQVCGTEVSDDYANRHDMTYVFCDGRGFLCPAHTCLCYLQTRWDTPGLYRLCNTLWGGHQFYCIRCGRCCECRD